MQKIKIVRPYEWFNQRVKPISILMEKDRNVG